MKDRQLKSSFGLFTAVFEEHHRQLEKWGIQDRNPFEWLAFLHEESGELAKAISEYTWREGNSQEVVKEAIQTATLALKIAEMFMKEAK